MVPTCNDAESDNEAGGVDPLCIRYDIEKDPTLSIGTALDRINLATKPNDITLAQAVTRVPDIILTTDALAAIKTKDDLQALTKNLVAGIQGSMQFYLLAGKASLAKTIRLNTRSLLQFASKVLPDGYDEKALRERVYDGVQKALSLKALPDSVKAGLAQAEKASLDALAKTPYLQGLTGDDLRKASDTLAKTLQTAVMSIEKDEANGLPKLRSTVLTTLARHKAVPFFFGKLQGMEQPLDYEAAIVGILGDVVTESGKATRTNSERLAAAKALATFKDREEGFAAISAVQNALQKARAQSTDNNSRELVESLLQALDPAPAPSDS